MFVTQLSHIIPMFTFQWMLNSPLGGLVVFFTMLGLVFIVKAVEHLGSNVWVDIRNELIILWWVKVKKRKLFRTVHASDGRLSFQMHHHVPEAAGPTDAGEVLFPGQPGFAESLGLAYSDEENDEELFYMCCKEELADILNRAGGNSPKAADSEDIPLSFLPRVTGEMPDEGRDAGEMRPEEFDQAVDADPALAHSTLAFIPHTETEAAGYTSAAAARASAGVSIFTELLLKCDSEAKLALMPELLEIGDQKELVLLESMKDAGDRRVQKMAAKLCDKLRKQLDPEVISPVDQNAVAPPGRPPSMSHDSTPADSDVFKAEPQGNNKLSLDLCFLREPDTEKMEGHGEA